MSSSGEKLIVCACGTSIPSMPGSGIVCPECGASLDSSPSTMLAPTMPVSDQGGAAPDEAAEDVHSLEWKVGDVILGRYAVLGQVGEGGMGYVYRVRHLGWNMDLAVKSPKPKILRRRRGVENFERECETWVNLGLHPHIVTCYYVRRVGNIPRVFAEYVGGGSLWEWIKTKKLYEGNEEEVQRRIVDAAIQFAWGLRHAHDQGLVHQDVKPGNVLMTPQGLLKVTDFGLARIDISYTDDAEPAQAGAKFAGMTRAYCSPEQARSETLTARSDMWGWAASVLEMYCTRVTWDSGEDAPNILKRAARGNYSNKDALRIPEGVISLLRACFQPNVVDRPAHMGEVAAELAAVYRSTFGTAYERPEPRMAEALADSLNNRAVSLMDLSRGEQAHAVWVQALRADPHHPESTFNSGLYRWREGGLTDDAFRLRLEDVRRFHPGQALPAYLLGQFFLEQGNYFDAKRALRPFRDNPNVRSEWREAEQTARERRPIARALHFELSGHNDAVTSLTHLAGQRILISGSADNTLKIWNCETRQCVRTLEGHSNSVTAVCSSADGRLVFSASRDRTIRSWEVATGRCLQTLEGAGGELTSVAVTRSHRQVLAATQDGSLRVWDHASGECEMVLDAHRGAVTAMALSSGGKYVFTAGMDGKIIRWDLENGARVCEFAGHEGVVNALALSEDGRILLSAGMDKTVRTWHAASGTALHVMRGHQGAINSVAISADGLYALTGSKDTTVRLWELGRGRCLYTFTDHPKPVLGLAWRRDGVEAASACEDGRIFVWRVNSSDTVVIAKPVLCQAASSELLLSRGQAFENHLHVGVESLQAGDIAGATRELRKAREQPGHQRSPEAIRAWQQLYTRVPRTQLRGLWESGLLEQQDKPIRAIQLTRSGRYAVVLSGANLVHVWDLVQRHVVQEFDTGTTQFEGFDVSVDGYDAVTSGWEVMVWNARKGQPRVTCESKGEVVGAVSLSPDGLWVATAESKSISIWDIHSGRQVRSFKTSAEVNALTWTPGGDRIVTGDASRNIILWQPDTGAQQAVLRGHEANVTALAVSPDGRRLLSGTGSIWARPGELLMWNLESLELERKLEGHPDSIFSIDWSGDSRYAITGSADHTAVLWDCHSGRRLFRLDAHEDSVFAARISPDGRFALTGGKDGALRIWTLDWELDEGRLTDWDEDATRHIAYFAALKRAYAAHERTQKRIKPNDELPLLLYQLGCAGFGSLSGSAVAAKLHQIESKGRSPVQKRLERSTRPRFWRR